ncbi:hypothetical protein G1C95_1043 [Bifidobacterium sp. DSM 109957]|uniref:Phage minor structural protein n=1 Tax=Bifidobacterium oedipodis TaxID=2675322 RepID=A0A7Y0HSC2_9BIFI|nr:hypothetical protein [Bifidobacterium sp. DSM 109957]
MEGFIFDLAEWAVTGVLAVVAGLLWKQMQEYRRRGLEEERRRDEEHAALRRGMQMQLRAQLVEMHHQWVAERGYMPVETKRLFHDMFCAYEALGENGIISSLYEDVKKAHVAPGPDGDEDDDD